jgi:LytS/YehU family sensor histidine kinase
MKIQEVEFNTNALLWIIPLVGLILTTLFMIGHGSDVNQSTLFQIGHGVILTAGLWLGCLFIVSYLWKKYPWEKYPVKHLIIEVILILAYTIAFGFLLYELEKRYISFVVESENIYISMLLTIFVTFLITSINEAVFFYKQWKLNFSRSVRHERNSIEARYETLKMQVNPHFLFNSLNSLTNIVEDNNVAVDYIQDLSEFLRYGLKSRDRELVLVRDEAEMLQKYLNLQKSRFKNNLHINNLIDKSTYHYSVPPMVIQMLVENCIKHNIISKENPLKISLLHEDEYIIIENNFQPKQVSHSTGQGLKNISERYKYFTTKEVVVKQTNGSFTVKIPLLLVEL